MADIDSREALQELKNRYEHDKVSLLLGAGFSKNAWSPFPSWDELLKDMISEMYGKRASKRRLIAEKGYLGIVSDYARFKGMREAVESYIENHIPFADGNQCALHFANDSSIQLKEEDLDIHKKLLSSRWNRIYTTNYDNLLEYVAEKNNLRWSVVTSADNLVINNDVDSLIIKLHGSIYNRRQGDRYRFEFDGNHHHRYIISQEDYDKYPTEHEAFTQLMRISLLQGTFCLIGFSGSDPNFLSWINWVRDVLVRSNCVFNAKNAKVFLIDVSGSDIEPAQEMFYKNHHIVRISLRDNDVINCIGADKKFLKKSDSACNRYLMDCFLSYINDNDHGKHVYNNLWRDLRLLDDNDKDKLHVFAEDIKKHMNDNIIVTDVHYQSNMFWRFRNKKLSYDEVNLLLIALKDTGLPFDYVSGLKEQLVNSVADDWQRKMMDKLVLRDGTLSNKNTDFIAEDDYAIYEKILRTAFLLDFKSLKELLFMWKPSGYYMFVKAVWVFMFDKDLSVEILKDFLKLTDNYQEKYWATELLRFFINENGIRYSTTKYKNLGLESLFDLKDKLLKECEPKKQKTKAYGDSDYCINADSSSYAYSASMKALQFIINLPCMPSLNYFIFMDGTSWYNVFKNIYEKHPYQALFFSIMMNDKDTLIRIGQDFAYSDILFADGTTKEIAKKLMAVLNSDVVPLFIKNRVLTIMRELLYVLPISIWKDGFMQIWRNNVLPNIENLDRSRELESFVFRCVYLLNDAEYTECVIKDCLRSFKKNRGEIMSILYYVDRTLHINIYDEVNDFIDSMDDFIDVQIIVNVNEYLKKKQILKLCDKVLSMVNGNINVRSSLNALCFLSTNSKDIKKVVKKSILEDKGLWDNGIKDNGSVSRGEFIKILPFAKVLDWSKEELVIIYNKLVDSAIELFENSSYKKGGIINKFICGYESLLSEMHRFLNYYKDSLKDAPGYDFITKKIIEELCSQREYKTLEEGLLSDAYQVFSNALRQLAYKKEEVTDELLDLVVSRALFSKGSFLERCVDVISYILNQYYNDGLSEELRLKISLILRKYDKDIIISMNCNFIDVLESFVSISEYLERLGFSTDDTQKWIGYKTSGRFSFRY